MEDATRNERERERLRRYSVAAYLWSPDSKKILFVSAGKLYLYSIDEKDAKLIAPEKSGVLDPKFSPDGRWISFVESRDLWIASTQGGKASRLTGGGSADILHGDLDWVYPEEFGVRTGYAWSPDSKRIAFMETDQSGAPTYPISSLTDIDASVDLQRYPKAGDPNPKVRIGVVNVAPGRKPSKVRWLDIRSEYIPRFHWVDERRLSVQTMNRGQTELDLTFFGVEGGRVRTVLEERDPHWINVVDDLRFLGEGTGFLWTSERSGFRHIYLYGYDGELRRQLTAGDWEVNSIDGFDPDRRIVYYTANRDNPLGAALYAVSLDGKDNGLITSKAGTHSIAMNGQATAFSDTYSGLTDPGRMTVTNLEGGQESLVHVMQSMDDYDLVEPELGQFKTNDGALVRTLLLRPRNIPSGAKLPLIVHVYGGPRAPTIRDA